MDDLIIQGKLKELYINGQLADIQDVTVIRKYTSPYFSDATKIFQDGTTTVTLPVTDNNCIIFGYANREDMFTDKPYIVLKASYYVNGLTIFENADTFLLSVSDVFEVQFTWGISKEKYLPLFTKKLNKIATNGTTILESDWVVNWNKTDMYAIGKKYKYIDYISYDLTQDMITIGGVVQPTTVADEPFLSSQKQMTLHPFIEANNILELIKSDAGIIDDFSILENELSNIGLILGGNADGKKYTLNNHIASATVGMNAQPIPMPNASFDANNILLTTGSASNSFYFNPYTMGLDGIVLNVTVSIYVDDLLTGIDLKEFGTGFETTTKNLTYEVTRPGGPNTNYLYKFSFPITNSSDNKGHYFKIFINGNSYSAKGIWNYDISFDYTLLNCIFGFNDSIGLYGKGRYDCLANLPQITGIEYIQQMLIITGYSIGHDENGNFKFYTLKQFTDNLHDGNVIDWSGRVSLTQKEYFIFNSNCQTNWIKYNNSDAITYLNKDSLKVQDLTQALEQDLYKLDFDLAEKSSNGNSKFILYNQTIKESKSGTPEVVTKSFDCSFSEKPSVLVENVNGSAYNEPILPNDTPSITSLYNVSAIDSSTLVSSQFYNIGLCPVGSKITKVDGAVTDITITGINKSSGSIITSGGFAAGSHTIEITAKIQGFVSKYYSTYQKLINRPIVKTVEVNLDFFESANLDFSKPIYIKEWGKYCLLLDIVCPDNEVSVANLLIINQQI